MNDNKRKIGLGKKEILKGKSFHKRTFRFFHKMKNYRPKICQIFQKVEVAT